MAGLMVAIQTKYDALNAAGFPNSTRPPRYLDRAPEISSGTQLYPPYVTFTLGPGDDLLTFESDSVEQSRLTINVYDTDQGNADQTMAAIRFNNQNVDQLAGFDAGTLPALTDGVLLSMLPTKPPTPAQRGKGKDGALVFMTTMEYLIEVQRS